MKKAVKYFSMVCICFALLGYGFFNYLSNKPIIANTSYAFVYSDEEATDLAEEIVIAKVSENLKTYMTGGVFPWTDSLMLVEKNLKGSLDGNFIFAQEGGFDENQRKNIQFDNYKVFEPGERYLMFIKKHPEDSNKYVSINSGITIYRISNERALNTMESRNKKLEDIENTIRKNKEQ